MSYIIEKLLGQNVSIVLVSGEEIYGTIQDADDVWLQVSYIQKKTSKKITKVINLCVIESIEFDCETEKKTEKNIQMTTSR